MAREIPITGIADLMEEEIEQVVKIVALEWTAEVKQQTPVVTGRLRNNWQTSLKLKSETIWNMQNRFCTATTCLSLGVANTAHVKVRCLVSLI